MRPIILALTLLLSLNSSPLFAQYPSAHNITLDSLLNWLEPNLQNPNIDSLALHHSHVALQRAREAQDSVAIAKSYLCLAEWHNFHADYFNRQTDSAIYYDHQAIEAYRALKDMKSVALMYYFLGVDLHGIARYSESEEANFQSIALYDSLNNEEMVAKNYVQLCNLYSFYGDTLRSIQYGEQGIQLLEQLGGDVLYPHFYTYLALAYKTGGQWQKAIETVDKSLALYKEQEGEERYWNPQYVQNYEIKADVYLEQKAYEQALESAQTALDISKEYDLESQYRTYLSVAVALTELGRYEEALTVIKAAEDYQNLHDFEDQSVADSYAATYEAVGDYRNALRYKKEGEKGRYKELKEEIKSLESELLIKYETEQKDETIANQSTQIQQQKRIQQLSFGIGGLLTLLLGGLFLTYRNNRKKNLQLAELNDDLFETNTQLDQRNAQNELLLKEIHHRVKNNLETVSSLLELQSAQVDDAEVQSVMQASQSRVQSMSILHQKLYQGKNLASIDMPDYFKNLVESILDTYDAWDKVAIKYDVAAIELDIDTAVPIGLIANELITNTLKYAFPDQQEGKIELSLQQKGQQLLFSVKDDGVGMQQNTTPLGTGFGSQLIRLLVTQLDGTMTTQHENGLKTTIAFEK